jgi:N-acetylglutamate synthase-like GNAT family acetyltransferase
VTYTIKSPQTDIEFQQYYELRWRILRAPWQQPRGSERDEYETMAIHAIAMDDSNSVVGVARLHQTDNTSAQIRYMAVDDGLQKSGVGKALLHYLEEQARALGVRQINLNARENCVGFYIKQGYHITGPGPVLYGEIKHQKMQKPLK